MTPTGSTTGTGPTCPTGSLTEMTACRALRKPSAAEIQLCGELQAYRFHDSVVLGPGPVYPDPSEATSSDLHFHPVLDPSIARPAGGPWYSNEVVWIAAPSYTDGILVRVAPVGHPGRAVLAPNLTDKLYLGPPPQPYTRFSSDTMVTSPGCYLWQVDGSDFSYTILFKATL